ncbi:MAG: mercury transporter MerC [Alteromonadaceae bacterium TMED7]|uniref:Mercury transporter MerC n=1 Tax=Alteromonas alba TaxID=2079529 RepID=A0A2S9V8E0_9ALTE|nr:organomercurial transporter MerC [Alteromonas alba]PRO72729.1 mercury transporter MerC [Alteromonas alba]RPH18191.1 MAG: mercury transporter MerC [Alteromonadaceae bacterium TMED7]|tara:strand:+ start:4427 stop:4813 length:387 start_codon:yes stop_codon:yes gene_type:complete
MFGTLVEKVGSTGTWLSALSCAACFPVLGSFGATIGLSFLSQFEGVAINTLLPIFASIALLGNGANWWLHRNHLRGIISILGPIAVLLTLYPLWQYGWSTYLFYGALILMLVVSVFDFLKPVRPQCRV